MIIIEGGASDRYRLLISDGTYFLQAMLATQLNEYITDERVVPRCLIRLDEFICNTVHDRQIAIILGLTDVQPPTQAMIGNPVAVEQTKGSRSYFLFPSSSHLFKEEMLQHNHCNNNNPTIKNHHLNKTLLLLQHNNNINSQ